MTFTSWAPPPTLSAAQRLLRPLPLAVLLQGLPPWAGRGLQGVGTPGSPTVSLLLWGRGPGWEKERQKGHPGWVA